MNNEQRHARIAALRADRDRLKAKDEDILRQSAALQETIAAADALPLVKLANETHGKQKKRKGSSSLAEDRPCGYPTGDEVCLRPRRRCERHLGWQKIRHADLELQADVTSRTLDLIERELLALGDIKL